MQVELYRPIETGRRHLIFILHGSAGALSRTDARIPSYENFGEQELAEHCFVVALPHYFDLFGVKSATETSFLRQNFHEIVAALAIILQDEEDLPETRNQTVGLLGESYGGYLAIALAAANPHVAALSEFGGGWPDGYEMSRHDNLSCLIFHGGDDTIVPSVAAAKMAQKLTAAGATVQLHIYPNEGHYLTTRSRQEMLDESVRLFLALQ